MSEKWLEDQRINYERYEIRAYFTNLFRKLPNSINTKSKNRKVLELGAGSGQLTDFLNEDNILKLDIIKMPGIDIQADIYKTPIKNSIVDEIILVDVFHHLGKPWVFFEECHRILKDDGFLVLVEPYRSLFSYPVFKIFHHEPMLFNKKYRIGETILDDNPTSADNGIPTNIFMNRNNKKYLDYLLQKKFKFENKIEFSDFLSFFATGGLNRNKSILKGKTYRFLLSIENYLPQFFLRLFGSRMIITLRKHVD
jgi:SAM-dependent methyltransferase